MRKAPKLEEPWCSSSLGSRNPEDDFLGSEVTSESWEGGTITMIKYNTYIYNIIPIALVDDESFPIFTETWSTCTWKWS